MIKKKKNPVLDIKQVQDKHKMKESLHKMKKNKNRNLKKSLNIKRMISFDVKFCKESVRILDKKFHSKSKVDFEYKFNKNIRYIYKTNYKNDIPYVLGQIYNFYASKKLEISKHILDDFKPKNNF